MNEDTPQPATASDAPIAPAASTAATGRSVPIAVLRQYVKDLSFECPNAVEVLANPQDQPSGNIHVDVRARAVSDTSFEVSLCLSVEARQRERIAYLVEIEYAGQVVIGEVPQEAVEPLLMVEAPRLLFPYARAILSAVTSDGGFSPLMVQPIDFAALYRDYRRRRTQAVAPAEAPAQG